MSNVRKEERYHTTDLEGVIQARKLCKYTLHIIKNNNVFKSFPNGIDDDINPPQYEVVAKIRETALDLYMSCFSANKVYLSKDNYKHRRQLQDKSISKCNELLALIELSKDLFHLTSKRVAHWGSFTLCVRSLLQSWKEKDYSRYKRM